MRSERELKSDIVTICHRLYSKGFISSTDGNVSTRGGKGKILITPSGVHKGFIKEEEIIIIDMDGKVVSGKLKPSSEIAMHLCVYREREDVNAIIHAHPTMCIAFSLAGLSLEDCFLPEVILSLGKIITARYATPTTEEVPRVLQEFVSKHDAIILERHGSLNLGKDLYKAYNSLERMEHAALIIHSAMQLGGIKPLPEDEVGRLKVIRERFNSMTLGNTPKSNRQNLPYDEKKLIEMISEMVIEKIQ